MEFPASQLFDWTVWETRPEAVQVEATLDNTVDVIVVCVTLLGSPFLPDLSEEDSVDPGRGAGTTVKLRSAPDKNQEARLDEILGPVWRQTRSMCRSEQSGEGRPDNLPQGIRIAAPNRGSAVGWLGHSSRVALEGVMTAAQGTITVRLGSVGIGSETG